MRKRVLIIGAGGRDFNNFFVYFKDNAAYEVVCFTAAQIPGIEKRRFPKKLAGRLYKRDIPIYSEEQLSKLIKRFGIDEVVLAYSDLSHQEVMEKASIVLAAGASFRLLGPNDTMLKSKKPVISICATRTGAGKSQTSRAIGQILKRHGKRIAAIRHPMPYGNLKKQVAQKFSSYRDLVEENCTIEEREEYEPWINLGFTVYAGVDYKKIIDMAERNVDCVIWDGGNNDWSFYKPDLNIVVADAMRPGHELTYYPGFVNLLMADVVVINKVNTAKRSDVRIIEENVKRYSPKAVIIKSDSVITADKPRLLKGKRVLIVEDGPTLTHGGLAHGAGYWVLKKYGGEIVDARKYAVGSLKNVYKKYKHLKEELPAMGYSKKQMLELQATINRAECDVVLDSSPSDLSKYIKVNKPIVNVGYELGGRTIQELERVLRRFRFI